jgi:hypothetical protein
MKRVLFTLAMASMLVLNAAFAQERLAGPAHGHASAPHQCAAGTCDDCGGQGKRSCGWCGGDGIRNGKQCTFCNGHGTIKCLKCGGSGKS